MIVSIVLVFTAEIYEYYYLVYHVYHEYEYLNDYNIYIYFRLIHNANSTAIFRHPYKTDCPFIKRA